MFNASPCEDMRIKIFSVFLILFFIILFWYGSYHAKTGTSASPHIYIPGEYYEFSPVIEGEEVRHDFVVLNKGTSELDLRDVKPDCGCTTVSYSRQIPPGREGKIAIKLDTGNYGGQHVTKTIFVRTNDKKKSEFSLVISGVVRPVADITPTEARLTGNVGQKIKQTVTIAPRSENRFRILEVKAEKGDNIRCDLAETDLPDGIRYQLTIYNVKQEKGWYIDNIYLKTSSKKSPVLKVRVLGYIRNGL
ncbi:MAG: DUF1573 domain-containing protein [Desulfomonilia bacterium]